jgi:hypothetical protein
VNRGRTLTVVAEGHLGLAETNGVLSLGDAIELFKLGLVDTLLSVSTASSSSSSSSKVATTPPPGVGGRLLAWLGKYSSMALMPMLVGREAICERVAGGYREGRVVGRTREEAWLAGYTAG